jgi:branched-chain amino acid transport system ATP-binding protein
MGLAPLLVSQIFEIVSEINAQGTTILLVEQNARMALKIADRGYVLQTGQVVVQGTSSDLQSNETVRKAYLGES